jgi:hypothetical protein
MAERPRLLVLDLLESFSRERDIDVRLERRRERHDWICSLTIDAGVAVRGMGQSAREAITNALRQTGIELPAA